MSYIDVTAKNEEEAIRKALEQLGLDRDDVSVEILERAKSGFLGIGAAPAKVRVTYEGNEAPQEIAVESKEEPKKEVKPFRPADPLKPAQKPAPRKEAPQKETPRVEPKTGAVTESDGEEYIPVPRPVENLGEECGAEDKKAVQIRAFLQGLLEHMEVAAEIKIYQPEKGRYKVFLEGAKLGALIGRRGETLDAIQQLTNYSVNRDSGSRVRIHVDAEGYREKREQSLERLAHKVAGKVIKYRRNVTLEPMNAYERHVIHTALQETPKITTYSTGTEPNRRVIVSYDRNKQ